MDFLADSMGKPRIKKKMLEDMGPKRERAAPRKLEAPVIDAISDLLSVHPRVAWAIRINSGMAWSGDAPVWFHKLLKPADKTLRMPDFLGQLTDGRVFAIEAKAPGWTAPRNEREQGQEAFLSLVNKYGGVACFSSDAAKAMGMLWK